MKSPKLNLDYGATLDEIKAAGYHATGLLTTTDQEPFTSACASAAHLEDIRRQTQQRGLALVMTALRPLSNLPLTAQIKDICQQIDNGQRVGAEFLLTFGVDQPEHFVNYYKLMAKAAAYAQDRQLKLVLKPHGGASGAAEEIIRCLEQVAHPNFKIWFDAGNIVFYTGKDPVEQLQPIAQHVTGFCAKDCDQKSGNVWIQFGTGRVDFRAVLGELKKAGFNGPVMVECCEMGETIRSVTGNAQKNREYLEGLLTELDGNAKPTQPE